MITITVNGERREVAPGTTVAGYLEGHGLAADKTVVERNREIVARDDFARTVLEADDRLELVRFVGGG